MPGRALGTMLVTSTVLRFCRIVKPYATWPVKVYLPSNSKTEITVNHMNILITSIAAMLMAGGCSTTDGKAKDKSTSQVAADTTKSALAPIPFTNGVTDANKGLKKGKIQVKGTTQFPSIRKVYIYEIEGRNKNKIDSATVANGAFDFGTDTYESGFYLLGLNDDNTAHFILNPSEPLVELQITNTKLEFGLTSPNSRENQGWFKYLPQEVAIQKTIKDNRIAQAKSTLKAQFDQVINQKEVELAKLQGNLIKEYPDTYLAKTLTWKQEPNRSDKARYWDNIDFTDESLIHSMVMVDRTQNFMRSHSDGGKESGYYNCIDLMVQKAKVNERVLEFVLYNTLSGFYESGMDNICLYIMDNYIFGDGCGEAEISSVLKKKAESIGNLQLGKTPPNIVMPGADGGNVDLMKLCARNKYTLVMFWSSWCEHCKGEAPEVKLYYDKWHAKGFEIVGVSIDTNPTAWKDALKERGFTFPNVCGMKGYDSKVARDYKISRTPGFFLLDASGKIVLKPNGIRQVDNWLSQNLK